MMPAEDVIGAVGFSVMSVRPGDTALAMGLSELPVVATSHLLHIMESATVAALSEYLENGETTYLLSTTFELLASAQVGDELRASARCTSIDGLALVVGAQAGEALRGDGHGEQVAGRARGPCRVAALVALSLLLLAVNQRALHLC